MKIINGLKQNYWLILILLVAALLRFYKLDFQSVWLDEIHTLNEASPKNSFSEVYKQLMIAEPHPPLYFYCIHYLFKIFGYTSFVLRFFSAVVGILGVYSVYLLGHEILNKRVGLISAMLVCVNSFHIYYSQDGRPYVFLFLFTALAFYRLIKFLKDSNLKNAMLYGVFAAFMISVHFFGLFALIAQYLILLFFLISAQKSERKKFFINSFLSGITTLILFIPSIKLFIQTTKIKDIWIDDPTFDAYTEIFHEFFGKSEILVCLAGLLLFFYMVKLSKQKNTPFNTKDIIENKTVFSFIVFGIWIFIVLIIPLIRSYNSLPMLISRYFINILPAIFIIIAIGIDYFRNKIVSNGLLLLFVFSALVDILLIKHYYQTITKSQFREVSEFIKDNNKNNEPVVTSLHVYFPYFLNNETVKMNIIGRTLDEYVSDMMADSTKIKPFWYVNAHGNPYKVNEATQGFLDKNFVVENNIDMVDSWTKHYVRISNRPTRIDISGFKPLKNANGDKINYWIENFETTNDSIKLNGWAYIDGNEANNSKIDIILIGKNQVIKLPHRNIRRDDITKSVRYKYNLDNSGFFSGVPINNLEKDNYRVGILISNEDFHKKGLVLTDKFFDKN